MQKICTPHHRLTQAAMRAVAFVLAALAGAVPAMAQTSDESTAGAYWTLEKQRQDKLRALRAPPIRQKPTRLRSGAAPVRGYTRPVDPAPPPEGETIAAPAITAPAITAPAITAPAITAPAITAPATVDVPALPAVIDTRNAKAVIAVLGDNLGQLLSLGLSEAYGDKPGVVILRRTKENSGLVRDDYYDWRKAARDLLDRDKPDLVILMIGSNDRQSLRDGATSVETRAARWKELYAARAKAIGEIFRDRKTPLIWVGLPIMNNERLASDLLDFNDIYKQAAAETGAAYVDTWEAFADDRGRFSSYGPDVNGQTVRLRASDGVHFTRAGSRKLAYFVEGDIRRTLEKTKPSLDPETVTVTAPGEAPAPLDLPVPDLPSADLPSSALPTLAEPTLVKPTSEPSVADVPLVPDVDVGPAVPQAPAPVPVIRPASGPVTPLTAPPVSPGGHLATAARPSIAFGDRDAAELVRKSLVEGRASDARPGRADDFAWPKAGLKN